MTNKKLFERKISREEINNAMKKFLDNGGKITKIEPSPRPEYSLFGESFDAYDLLGKEESSFMNI